MKYEISAKFGVTLEQSERFCKMVQQSADFEFGTVQKRVNCVDLEKCCKF